jgi:hypothetical protein
MLRQVDIEKSMISKMDRKIVFKPKMTCFFENGWRGLAWKQILSSMLAN